MKYGGETPIENSNLPRQRRGRHGLPDAADWAAVPRGKGAINGDETTLTTEKSNLPRRRRGRHGGGVPSGQRMINGRETSMIKEKFESVAAKARHGPPDAADGVPRPERRGGPCREGTG